MIKKGVQVMKRWITFLLCFITLISIAGCGLLQDVSDKKQEKKTIVGSKEESEVKAGFIFSSDSEDLGTKARIEGIRKMQKKTGLKDSQIVMAQSVTENNFSDTIQSMIEDGCVIIFSTDAAFEDEMIAAAKEQPDVEFCQEMGENAKSSKLSNMHNYYTRIYEAYYISGITAGMKLNDMLNEGDASLDSCAVGFVASEESAQTISCYSAFYIGVRQMNSQVGMKVRYVGESGDVDKDKEAANQLVAQGVTVMASFTSTNGVASVCAGHNIPVIGSEENVISAAPDDAITSAVTDWSVYYIYAVNACLKGEEIETDWCEGYKEGAVGISQLNDNNLVDGTLDQIASAESDLCSGKTKIFDTANFTVEGESIEEAVNHSKYKSYAGFVSEGEFHESERSSAPAFDLMIDGIEISEEDYVSMQQEALEEAQEDE